MPAISFALLMRVAGIPSRIVLGYLGGESNPLGDYLLVRQSDAHAWVEVWLEGRGWVRVDPTAAVDPRRVVAARPDLRVPVGAFMDLYLPQRCGADGRPGNQKELERQVRRFRPGQAQKH